MAINAKTISEQDKLDVEIPSEKDLMFFHKIRDEINCVDEMHQFRFMENIVMNLCHAHATSWKTEEEIDVARNNIINSIRKARELFIAYQESNEQDIIKH